LRYGICCVVVSFAKRFMVSLTMSVGWLTKRKLHAALNITARKSSAPCVVAFVYDSIYVYYIYGFQQNRSHFHNDKGHGALGPPTKKNFAVWMLVVLSRVIWLSLTVCLLAVVEACCAVMFNCSSTHAPDSFLMSLVQFQEQGSENSWGLVDGLTELKQECGSGNSLLFR
jgi:hypothetical protein